MHDRRCNMSLQDILNQEYALEQAIKEVADDEALDVLSDALNNIEDDKNTKIDNYVGFIASLERREKAIADELRRLQDRKKVTSNLQDRARERLCYTLISNGIEKIVTDLHSVTVAKSGTKPLVWDEVTDVPDAYRIISWKPDNAKIKEALVEGATIPGFSLGDEKVSVRIK